MKIGWFKKREGEALAPWLPEELIPHLAKDPRIIEAVLRGAQNCGVDITDKEVKLISKRLADKQGGGE